MMQDWLCERCLQEGHVNLPRHIDVWGAIEAVYTAHNKISPDCVNNRNKIRVRNPALMSDAEWREQKEKVAFKYIFAREGVNR